jgi:ABC-type dipeptide/oligopeptide/nickel transport system permease subunit
LLFGKKKYLSGSSLSSLAWKKFRNNPLGFNSMLFILSAGFLALLGYLVTPDSTPYSNDQCLELGIRRPGFSAIFLMVHKNQPADHVSLVEKMLWGKRSDYIAIPIQHYRFEGTDILVEEYADTIRELPPERSFNLADVLYPLGSDTTRVICKKDNLIFRDIEGKAYIEPIDEMKREIILKNIIKRTYILGTDRFGRDLLSQMIIGARVSLSVGLISVTISLLIGILLGSVAGYFRGRTDSVILWFINVVWSIPTLLLVIAINFALGKGFWQVFVAVGLTMWVEVARVVRGQFLSLREAEFVESARALGYSDLRIIIHHILPNIFGVIIVIAAANFASAILLEAGLSFLGIGVQPPMPSWGSMIKENYGYIILDSAYLAILPGIAILLMVLAFMMMGNALRDALDVKTSML